MASIKEDSRQKVAELVAKFQALAPGQVRDDYNEANTINGFVRPLFEALGWDFSDISQMEAERTIAHGRADFILKVRGVARLVLEVKALRHSLLGDRESAKQAINYAYNKGLNWAVLTNFDSLQLFNAQRETRDPVEVRFLALDYRQFLANFDDLWLLSRRSVAASSLDKAGERYGHLKTRTPIDKHLYNQLRAWRERLFNEIYLHHKDKGVTEAQADVLVQQFFNRLIFIRAAEDRQLTDNQLRAMLHQWASAGRKAELVPSLRRVFRRFASTYDSELFPVLDTWDNIWLSGDTIADVVDGLYDLPGRMTSYDFSVIGPDVLGRVYEQYLGWVAETVRERTRKAGEQLALLPGEPAYQMVEKKQKRKRGGIYYTPEWVVDYIVGQTVGRFINEHRHDEVLDVKVLDPACGSGSFLIKAYDELLRYHAQRQGIPENLAFADRMPLLKNNIFGLDLDPQAVEIARLNLLLSALAQPEALPKLANNIRWGNALISGGETELTPYFGDGWEQKRPFNWGQEFPDIMARGGFDSIIGNPPYVRIQSIDRDEADYYYENYDSAFGSFDVSVVFLERAISLLRPQGRLGFITSGKFLKSQYGKRVQQFMRRNCVVESILDLSHQQVFPEATNYPVVIVLRKAQADEPLRYTFLDRKPGSPESPLDLPQETTASQDAILKGMWPLPGGKVQALLDKLSAQSVSLAEVSSRIFQGLITSADAVYILKKRGEARQGLVSVYSRAKQREYELEVALLKPFLTGRNISRYYSPLPSEFLLFPYKVSQSKATLLTPEELASAYPSCWQYLLDNRQVLQDREAGKMRHEGWYAFGRTQNLALHDQPKIAIPSTVRRLTASYDSAGQMYLDNVRVNGILLKDGAAANYKYITGLLNSRLLHWCFAYRATPFANGWYGANRQFIEHLPIRRIDPANAFDKQMHGRLVALVERMLDLHQRLAQKGDIRDQERQDLEHQIELTDREIDELVYDLYGLTAEERALVEASRGIRRQ